MHWFELIDGKMSAKCEKLFVFRVAYSSFVCLADAFLLTEKTNVRVSEMPFQQKRG